MIKKIELEVPFNVEYSTSREVNNIYEGSNIVAREYGSWSAEFTGLNHEQILMLSEVYLNMIKLKK